MLTRCRVSVSTRHRVSHAFNYVGDVRQPASPPTAAGLLMSMWRQAQPLGQASCCCQVTGALDAWAPSG